jgi:hypothetical protein
MNVYLVYKPGMGQRKVLLPRKYRGIIYGNLQIDSLVNLIAILFALLIFAAR